MIRKEKPKKKRQFQKRGESVDHLSIESNSLGRTKDRKVKNKHKYRHFKQWLDDLDVA